MKALLKNYRQSPRKVRLVADLVKGKTVGEALMLLSFNTKRANSAIRKLIASAAANAKHNQQVEKELYIKDIRVDGGLVMKRSMPRARGSAFQILKRTSRVMVELDEYIPRQKHAKRSVSKIKEAKS